MILSRLTPEPGVTADFYHEALESLGALCERAWHDRLEVVAEGAAARLWRDDDGLHEVALRFAAAGDSTGTPDPARDVFPGCPLTFRLTEALRSTTAPIERFALAGDARAVAPDAAVAEKLWYAQHPGWARWRLAAPFVAAHHFSLVATIRCEVQAIDQHWSLHRLALSLWDGTLDEALAASLSSAAAGSSGSVEWPVPEPERWHALLSAALDGALAPQIAPIRVRQERQLTRELGRIEQYFDHYEAELAGRRARSHKAEAQGRLADRLAAARSEREHRRRDQVARHEIRVAAHLDALLLVAEPAWRAKVTFIDRREPRDVPALLVPRTRRWML